MKNTYQFKKSDIISMKLLSNNEDEFIHSVSNLIERIQHECEMYRIRAHNAEHSIGEIKGLYA